MTDWVSLDTPPGRKSWVDYERMLEIRVQAIGERYEVSLLRCDWNGGELPDGPIDLYVTIVHSLDKVSETVKWIMANVDSLIPDREVEVE